MTNHKPWYTYCLASRQSECGEFVDFVVHSVFTSQDRHYGYGVVPSEAFQWPDEWQETATKVGNCDVGVWAPNGRWQFYDDDYDHYGTELWIPKAIAETYLPAELFEEWLERSIEQRDDEDDERFDTNIRVEFDKYSPADPNDSDGYLYRDDLLAFNGIDPSIQQKPGVIWNA